MASDQNPYASSAAVCTTGSPADSTKYIAWFVTGTLVGVVSASVFQTTIQFVLHIIPAQPIRYATIYSIAAVVSVFVSLFGYNRSRPLNPKILDIAPRVIGGFALGLSPYFIGRVIAGLAPDVGTTIPSLNSAFTTATSIATGAVISVGAECGTRAVIRYFALLKNPTNHGMHADSKTRFAGRCRSVGPR